MTEIKPRAVWFGALLIFSAATCVAEEESLFPTELFESPWKGEPPSRGQFSVRHAGQGKPPEKGYFLKHKPGEVAEFHLFVPEGLDPRQRYPLVIAYHGGKDGASGKGTCRRWARLSTQKHPVIVLAPNMYTMDAYRELMKEGTVPIDPRRVIVYGHSSGGMGVLSAMREYLETEGAFVPAALICASTTASMGRAKYPPCPYYVIVGERETPEFVNSEILKYRRETCRIHALTMQQAFAETRYVEIPNHGHSDGTPAHMAILQHAIAVSARTRVDCSVEAKDPLLQDLVMALRKGEWLTVRKEIDRLEEMDNPPPKAEYESLRRTIDQTLEAWFEQEVHDLAHLAPRSSYVERDRAFHRYDRCREIAKAFAGTSLHPRLSKLLETLDQAEHFSAERKARQAYLRIVSQTPDRALIPQLVALRKTSPDTEYGRNRTREKQQALQALREQPPDGPPIHNPYFTHVKWRVWRDDETPVEKVRTLVRKGKETSSVEITLQPTPLADRRYPAAPLRTGEPIRWETKTTPSDSFAGCWDDVYASWSGLHGYVRPAWRATDGSDVNLRPAGHDQFMHFVETRKTAELNRCGINFVHQSTTGMGHTLTNSRLALLHEQIYFADCLVTAPAHQSFTEEWPDRTKDLYLAHAPIFFHSIGSSNSETMAITKLMIVGGYLKPELKRTIKRHGLYPSVLLYLWKAGLPFDVPYDHELRHRIVYRSLGREDQFAGRYGHAGSERGNLSLDYHRYDEITHMRNMIRMAQAMETVPPEAILDNVSVQGGQGVYALRKSALILQEPGQTVTVQVSSNKCYDIQNRPITVRWKLLYGHHGTTCEPGKNPGSWTIRVPWDDDLPEGRTAVALIANNGIQDSNPAIVTIFRKRQDLPPSGVGYGDYQYNSPHANRRPVILDLQDRIVKPGETVHFALRAVDPEQQPVRFYKRAGEPGKLVGNVYTFHVPEEADPDRQHTVTFIASDGTAGNSYAAKRVNLVVDPQVHAHIHARSPLIGPAPLTVNVSAEGSYAAKGSWDAGWEFFQPAPKRTSTAWDQQPHDKELSHTFTKPGLYTIALTVKQGEAEDRETISVWVTEGKPPAKKGGILLEGNGVRIPDKSDSPSRFNHTDFGRVTVGEQRERTFELFHRGENNLITSESTIAITGPHANEFHLLRTLGTEITPGGYSPFVIQFRPQEKGTRTAHVTVRTGEQSIRFAIMGQAQ